MKYNVGNWVLVSGTITQKKLTVYDLVAIEEYMADFEPIPLTTEILVKAGFVKVKNRLDIYEKDRLRLWVGVRGETLSYLIEEDTTTGHYIKSIYFVNELQNLVHAISGEELPIQL